MSTKFSRSLAGGVFSRSLAWRARVSIVALRAADLSRSVVEPTRHLAPRSTHPTPDLASSIRPRRHHLAGATSKAVGAEGDPKIGTREQRRGREGNRCSPMICTILTSLCLAMPARTPTSQRLQELRRPRSGPPGYLNRRRLGNTWDSRTGSNHEGGWA